YTMMSGEPTVGWYDDGTRTTKWSPPAVCSLVEPPGSPTLAPGSHAVGVPGSGTPPSSPPAEPPPPPESTSLPPPAPLAPPPPAPAPPPVPALPALPPVAEGSAACSPPGELEQAASRTRLEASAQRRARTLSKRRELDR